MKEKASIKSLIAANPNGLLELKPPLTISEYRDNYGFKLKNVFTIYESRRVHYKNVDWFAFPQKTLETIFSVQEESQGDLLVVFIVETIKSGQVTCHLILSNEAYRKLLNDKSAQILKVHQMYTKYFTDHIALNMATA
jgi:hypothetical protein